MNFLAHILLSGNDDAVMMGNYVGDFVKGRLTDEKTAKWNPQYVRGLKLHRFIDSFTDSHSAVREVRALAAQTFGKSAGIVLDIYFDYFLAVDFENYRPEGLKEYAHNRYSVIEKNEYLIPAQMIPMVRSMIRQDWLCSYATMDGIALTFSRLSRRASFLQPIVTAADELERNKPHYQHAFDTFFPELQDECARFLVL